MNNRTQHPSATPRLAQSQAHPDGSPAGDHARLSGNVDPLTAAAVVIDVQRLFTDMTGAPIDPPLDLVLPRIGRFVQNCRDAGVMVVLVRTIIPSDAHSLSTLQWPEFMRAGMVPGSPGIEFNSCLDRRPEDVEVVKTRYSAFFGTSLDELLRARGIETVMVLGLTTNVCVQSSARDAWQRDYQTITVADCCAEIGAGSHDASLAWTARNFGVVLTSHELSSRWTRPMDGTRRADAR
jgi:nicotinamidase-related amidase